MFLSDCDCYNALSHVDKARFFTRFESSAPSGEEAALGYGRSLLRAGAER